MSLMNAPMNKDKIRIRKQRSVSHTHFANPSTNDAVQKYLFPSVSSERFNSNEEYQELEHQVAGHKFIKGKNSIGLLKCKNGTILKPISKPEVGLREVRFYEQLQTTTDPSLLEMKGYISEYFGTRIIDINGKQVEFIILENLLEGMSEPCIVDIKIGKQTWGPAALPDKILREQKKYEQCKNDLGFCIPGFQVYKHSTGRLHRYNKDYGKKLNGSTAVEALKIFLNGDVNGHVNRELLMQLLTMLWKIQKWARRQSSIKLYATSLLIVYDFKMLKRLRNLGSSGIVHSTKPQKKISFNSPESYSGDVISSFSGQISTAGPILTSSPGMTNPLPVCDTTGIVDPDNTQSSWHRTFHSMRRSHSFHINYNDYLSKIKQDYASTLEELNESKDIKKKQWCNVKIIDFAHVYSSDDQSVDSNYIEGLDNVVNIFEKFLYSLT